MWDGFEQQFQSVPQFSPMNVQYKQKYRFEIAGWAEENNRVLFPSASSESKEYSKGFDFAWEWKWYDTMCLPLLLLSSLIFFF